MDCFAAVIARYESIAVTDRLIRFAHSDSIWSLRGTKQSMDGLGSEFLVGDFVEQGAEFGRLAQLDFEEPAGAQGVGVG